MLRQTLLTQFGTENLHLNQELLATKYMWRRQQRIILSNDQNWIQYLLYLNQLWYMFIWNSHLVEQVFDFQKQKCFTWMCG